jgi:hypothetical protein
MVPEPSRTSANKHHPTAPTCGISKTSRSGHDRNNLDTVEVTDPSGHHTTLKLCRSAAPDQMNWIPCQSLHNIESTDSGRPPPIRGLWSTNRFASQA